MTPEEIYEIRKRIKLTGPLVHCIANNVTANFCANAVNAMGAKPIMTEFYDEIPEITSASDAVSLNLGTISESKMRGIEAAGKTASEHHIPAVIDIVGAACSSIRLRFAKEFTEKYFPAVIKGNQSEIFAFLGIPHGVSGIDSDDKEIPAAAEDAIRSAAEKYGAVIMMTGKTDIISDGKRTAAVSNGSGLMKYTSGTGCVLGAVTGCFLAAAEPFEAAVSAAVTMGLAGEYAEKFFLKNRSISEFSAKITDGLFSGEKDFFIENAKFRIFRKG